LAEVVEVLQAQGLPVVLGVEVDTLIQEVPEQAIKDMRAVQMEVFLVELAEVVVPQLEEYLLVQLVPMEEEVFLLLYLAFY